MVGNGGIGLWFHGFVEAGRELAVFGKDQEVLAALSSLGASLDGEIALDPAKDSWALGLLYDPQSLLQNRNANHRPHRKDIKKNESHPPGHYATEPLSAGIEQRRPGISSLKTLLVNP